LSFHTNTHWDANYQNVLAVPLLLKTSAFVFGPSCGESK